MCVNLSCRQASLRSTVDTALGASLERAVRLRHERRLARLGWSRALSPPDHRIWATAEPPPRPGCRLELLVDGEPAFAAVAEVIAAARKSVPITGWHVAPHFELVRGTQGGVLGALLAETAERLDVRVLVWPGRRCRPSTRRAVRSRSPSGLSPAPPGSAVRAIPASIPFDTTISRCAGRS